MLSPAAGGWLWSGSSGWEALSAGTEAAGRLSGSEAPLAETAQEASVRVIASVSRAAKYCFM